MGVCCSVANANGSAASATDGAAGAPSVEMGSAMGAARSRGDVVLEEFVHQDAITRVVVTSGGHRLLVADEAGVGRVCRLLPAQGPMYGAHSATGSSRLQVLAVWNLDKAQGPGFELSLQAASRGITDLALAPHGDLVALTARSGELVLVSLPTDQQPTVLHTLKGSNKTALAAVTFVPVSDGLMIVTGSRDGWMGGWQVSNSTAAPTQVWEEHINRNVVTALLGLDAGLCLQTSEDKLLRCWDVRTGACVRTSPRQAALQTCMARAGASFVVGQSASATGQASLQIWSPELQLLQTFALDVHTVAAVAVQGQLALALGRNGTIVALDIQTGVERYRTAVGAGVRSLALWMPTPSTPALRLVVGQEGRVRIKYPNLRL
ncbi:uncharacterized protein MONBRDRAFT_8383 [Monosiga brevicollis MX1]|uniref:Anaphase-promoting complex subunit 4 WD40 domain-containing protein n=1 Tax=Monosiga brevicollis TaxID=81824 RepID=A9V0N2_MONBE|nr:uncharacterized protein MONBRDRAFT_8383 [Monosiga brevicollis MX1]EDQ89047.1 predicted protein [Monosiga brevicollis MX1]|eukprot:XP_001746152.1 hypothetical protein [Monosiga brevicollis MX1]